MSRWIARDGWSHRRFDWPAARPRGRLLFQGGRADVFEKYLEAIAHLHAAGWSITSFDWRGQGGSGRLSPDPAIGHIADLGVLVDDLAAFWAEWRAEGAGQGVGPHVALGHSMGGHLLLRALAERRIDPAAAILSAPMVAVRSPIGAWAGTRLARFLAGRGDPARAAWQWREDPRSALRRNRRLTTDSARGQDDRWWLAHQPELHVGAPSWAWVAEAFAAGSALERDPRLAHIACPILLLVAEADRLVDARATHRAAARLPDVEIVRFGAESAHEILRETDIVQARAFAAIDAFLDRRVPA